MTHQIFMLRPHTRQQLQCLRPSVAQARRIIKATVLTVCTSINSSLYSSHRSSTRYSLICHRLHHSPPVSEVRRLHNITVLLL